MPYFLIISNAFKESLTAKEAGSTIQSVLRKHPNATVKSYPLSDGGNGFLDAVKDYTSSQNTIKTSTIFCQNAIGKKTKTQYLILNKNCAVIEVAKIIGLEQIKKQNRKPLHASSFGVGQAILHALNQGIRRFIIGLGGSATTDGGTGIAQALGFRFFEKDKILPHTKSPLASFTHFDLVSFDSRLKSCKFEIICDVKNPLLGKDGAVSIFAPQKGASQKNQTLLESQMKKWAKQTPKGNSHLTQGTGAAGGIGFFFQAYTKSKMQKGSPWMIQYANLKQQIAQADLVITTEGQLDSQSVQGKLISQLAKECKTHNKPLIAIVGGLKPGWEKLQKQGLTAAFSLCPYPTNLTTSMSNAKIWLKQISEQIANLYYTPLN